MNARDRARELAAVLLHFANGGEVESEYIGGWQGAGSDPAWNFGYTDYRIKDPYAALKEAAKDPTKQIRLYPGPWNDSEVTSKWQWDETFHTPDYYEIRDKPKPVKKVKLLAYLCDHKLYWFDQSVFAKVTPSHCSRVPAEDKEITIENQP